MTGSTRRASAPAGPAPLSIFFASAASLVTDHFPFGEGLIAWHLLEGLARRGHRVVACADSADLRSRPSFELVLLPDATRLESVGAFTRPYAIRRAFERRGGSDAFDVVHWLFPQMDEEVRLPPTRNGCATVLGPLPIPWSGSDREHGFRAGDLVRGPLRGPLRRRYAKQRAGADVLLASLPEATRGLPEREAGRARLVAFGVDAARYEVAPLPVTPTIAFVGRLIEAKRVRVLYEAFRRLRDEGADVRLVVAGDGPLLDWLRTRTADDGLQDRVDLLGAVPHDRVAGVLARASVLCLPSVGEPFGMVILEAMAAGRPVVAVDAAGPRALIDDGRGGRLVGPDDAVALASALGDVLGDPSVAADMGRHNRRLAEGPLSWESVLDAYEAAYRSALPSPG